MVASEFKIVIQGDLVSRILQTKNIRSKDVAKNLKKIKFEAKQNET